MCTCVNVHWYDLATFVSQFSPTMWVSGIELRLPGLVASTFTLWVILLGTEAIIIGVIKDIKLEST